MDLQKYLDYYYNSVQEDMNNPKKSDEQKRILLKVYLEGFIHRLR